LTISSANLDASARTCGGAMSDRMGDTSICRGVAGAGLHAVSAIPTPNPIQMTLVHLRTRHIERHFDVLHAANRAV
jgi:nitrate/nitrite transporter NarK